MNKIIEIVVSPSGQSTVATRGFIGQECRDASRLLELALGARTGEKLTAEFHAMSPVQAEVRAAK